MSSIDQIEIPFSKTKMVLTLLGSLVFIGLGLWFVIDPPASNHRVFGNPTRVFTVGLVSMLFFGLVCVVVIRKLVDNRPGLIIHRQGIVDNTSGVSAGLIPWGDIEDIEISQVMNQKFIMIIVNNPEFYLNKVNNPLKKNAIKMNYLSYGSPISISSNSLQTNFNDLLSLLTKKMAEFKS